MNTSSSSFSDELPAIRVLSSWRLSGHRAAVSQLHLEFSHGHAGILLSELHKRLNNLSGPRLLIDGIYLSLSFGGIRRVWSQIIDTFLLPGMITENSPIAVIDRNQSFFSDSSITRLEGVFFEPFDYSSFSDLSTNNSYFVNSWRADVFCSTWISSSGDLSPSCPELALVHDCIPEKINIASSPLQSVRHRWLSKASSLLTVSSDTAHDYSELFPDYNKTIHWSHLAPCHSFADKSAQLSSSNFSQAYNNIISQPFILLPGSGVLGSYKNPEFLGRALCDPSLSHLSLVISGLNSSSLSDSLISNFPLLQSRIHSVGFTDQELIYAYRQALAVVIPSHMEGYGLPVVEVMASGGLPLIANSIGLREAGADASLRFSLSNTSQLISLLQLVSDSCSRSWLFSLLKPKFDRRLLRLNSDLIGLALLASARLIPY